MSGKKAINTGSQGSNSQEVPEVPWTTELSHFADNFIKECTGGTDGVADISEVLAKASVEAARTWNVSAVGTDQGAVGQSPSVLRLEWLCVVDKLMGSALPSPETNPVELHLLGIVANVGAKDFEFLEVAAYALETAAAGRSSSATGKRKEAIDASLPTIQRLVCLLKLRAIVLATVEGQVQDVMTLYQHLDKALEQADSTAAGAKRRKSVSGSTIVNSSSSSSRSKSSEEVLQRAEDALRCFANGLTEASFASEDSSLALMPEIVQKLAAEVELQFPPSLICEVAEMVLQDIAAPLEDEHASDGAKAVKKGKKPRVESPTKRGSPAKKGVGTDPKPTAALPRQGSKGVMPVPGLRMKR
eukprot:TRINITY_DN1288_c0_g1_i1.p1 TRINITY_DN1288_c0_g1~~TRINITY_DN1288_c0_g1_i1.p1  ORF type:complete len:359 (+),score=88.51 TRINITY_DN1288_c0_g1_i1:85-1161(+)